VWRVGAVGVAKLPQIGFKFTTDQLFWLAALPGLSGATLRIFYSFMVPVFGGRLWTTLSTWSLILPALGIGFAVQNPNTPYLVFVILALLCGFGGGNFASSMANISFFFPKREKGNALALNAGLGNLGVSVVQFVVPLVITAGVFGAIGGEGVPLSDGQKLFVQNAGFIWVPFIAVSAIAAWFGMNDLATAKASFADQAVIFRRAHNWIMCWLYTGTFGSFIGFSAAFPLLAKILFPEVNTLQLVFLGPLVGALSRAGAGKACDRIGGGRITFWVFIAMSLGVCGILYAIGMKGSPSAFPVFFASFLFLFAATGVGNASTFQMIPAIMRKEIGRLETGMSTEQRVKQSDKESAAIIGFTSAIAAYGAFFIPKSFGTSIALTGGASAALYSFLGFYLSCIAITWWFYTRRGGLLFDVERGGPTVPTPSLRPAE
ncbi:MAG: MFS transporter, partial [Rhizobiales bacterium PAR1]